MASVSISHLILFIASLVVAASVAGTLVSGVDQLSNSMADRSWDLSDRISTDVRIISDPASGAIYDNDTEELVLLVKNTGSVNLAPHPTQLDVLVNGRYVGNLSVEPISGDGWETGSVVRIVIGYPLDPGDHRVLLNVDGNEATIRFRV